jgi:hypothetical protein
MKTKITIQLPTELVDAIRTIVYMTPGISMRSLFEEALIKHLHEIDEGAKGYLENKGLIPGRKVKMPNSLDIPK